MVNDPNPIEHTRGGRGGRGGGGGGGGGGGRGEREGRYYETRMFGPKIQQVIMSI